MRPEVVTVQPSGPTGVIAVRLTPDAAPQLLATCLVALANIKIGLADMLQRHAVSALEERVAGAEQHCADRPARKQILTHWLPAPRSVCA